MTGSKKVSGRSSSKRYGAKLLFQFRIASNGRSSKRRLCEERIIVFDAKSDDQAVAVASKRGAAAEHDYLNVANGHVYFEFIGIRDMIQLGWECEKDEVWYDIHERLAPMERRRSLIPSPERLFRIRGFNHRAGEFVNAVAPAAPKAQGRPNKRAARDARKRAARS